MMKIVRQLDAVRADGTKSRVTISLGEPYPSGNSFRCPVSIEGIHFEHDYSDIGGWDPLQSSLLAVRLAKEMLEDFIDHGGLLYYPDSEDVFTLEEW